MTPLRTQRLRAGLYRVTVPAGPDHAPQHWTAEQRREPAEYGGAWLWYATCDDDRDAVLDPLPTLRDVKRALLNN